jgi:GNAT superfamily N-acetyltransferase
MTIATTIRLAEVADADAVGRLLHDFNTEFDEPTPDPQAVAERVRRLLADDELTVVIADADADADAGPEGLAVLRFRPSLLKATLDCYLEALYVVADRRGKGIGRALLDAVIDLARRQGAAEMHLGTNEHDTAARRLYESIGFSNREPSGALNFFFEREL